MTIQEKEHAKAELERVCKLLEGMGIEYEVHNPFVSFKNGFGDCFIFPSQTYDGKLRITYAAPAWCDTADEALTICGILEDE